MVHFFINIILVLVLCPCVFAVEVTSIEKFMDNAVFDAWDHNSNSVLFLRKDEKGILQIFKVKKTLQILNQIRYASVAMLSGQSVSSYPPYRQFIKVPQTGITRASGSSRKAKFRII